MIYLDLFLSFLQIGAFSFGGGYAAMPLIQEQVVNRHLCGNPGGRTWGSRAGHPWLHCPVLHFRNSPGLALYKIQTAFPASGDFKVPPSGRGLHDCRRRTHHFNFCILCGRRGPVCAGMFRIPFHGLFCCGFLSSEEKTLESHCRHGFVRSHGNGSLSFIAGVLTDRKY